MCHKSDIHERLTLQVATLCDIMKQKSKKAENEKYVKYANLEM
jgi:hypothetical protein